MPNYIQDQTWDSTSYVNPTRMNVLNNNDKALDTQVKKNADAISALNNNFGGKNYDGTTPDGIFTYHIETWGHRASISIATDRADIPNGGIVSLPLPIVPTNGQRKYASYFGSNSATDLGGFTIYPDSTMQFNAIANDQHANIFSVDFNVTFQTLNNNFVPTNGTYDGTVVAMGGFGCRGLIFVPPYITRSYTVTCSKYTVSGAFSATDVTKVTSNHNYIAIETTQLSGETTGQHKGYQFEAVLEFAQKQLECVTTNVNDIHLLG